MWSVTGPDGSVATGWYLVPLRLFIGATFLFAGLQKLANPQFFRKDSPTSIYAQMEGSSRLSPIHVLISPLVHIAPAVGLVIAVGEVAVGLGVLVGLWMRVAAAAGMLLSLSLFLAVSFHSSPYYNGSDIVFLFAWTPLVLAGAAGAPALDTWLAQRSPASAVPQGEGLPRRAVLSTGAMTALAAAVVVAVGGLAAAFGRAVGGTSDSGGNPVTLAGGSGSTTPSTLSTPTTGVTPTTGGGSQATTSPVPSGTAIGPASDVPVGGSAAFTDPATGDPSLVIQQTAGKFVAFDAVCPHAGCTVAYQSSSKIIACPCHGSEFNPRNGDVIRGPATYGLTPIRIITGANGNLYVPQ
jgi:thiosulfate dehydrogenase (quinone) large subunit